jgi:hypothetical protein
MVKTPSDRILAGTNVYVEYRFDFHHDNSIERIQVHGLYVGFSDPYFYNIFHLRFKLQYFYSVLATRYSILQFPINQTHVLLFTVFYVTYE